MVIQNTTHIGLKSSLNKVTSVICIYNVEESEDNIKLTGNILNNKYNSLILADQLIKIGAYPEEIMPSHVGPPTQFNTSPNQNWFVKGIRTTASSEDKVKNVTVDSFLELHNKHLFLYMFSEADNKWYVSRSDDQGFKPLDEELAKL
jgi:hypothetical protein